MTAMPSDPHLDMVISVLTGVVPGLAVTAIAADDTFTGSLGLDSLTIASFAVALNRALGAPRAIETWIADASTTGQDSLGALAAWLAAETSRVES
jgi:acyl carrier protein